MRGGKPVLTRADVALIIELHEHEGITYEFLAEHFGISSGSNLATLIRSAKQYGYPPPKQGDDKCKTTKSSSKR